MPYTETTERTATREVPVHVVPAEDGVPTESVPTCVGDAGPTLMEWAGPTSRFGRAIRIGIESDGHNLVVVGVTTAGGLPAVTRLLSTSFETTPTSEQLTARLRAFLGAGRFGVHVVLTTPRAVVRHFVLPPVPVGQRRRAALWEGQKLIPFPLNDQEAVYGMSFVRAGAAGWRVTLVAVPQEDTATIFQTVARLGWKLRSVSLMGTERRHRARAGPGAGDGATVVWSQRRGAFSVFREGQLTFHYDLGPMPAAPAESDGATDQTRTAALARWISAMGAAIGDAFDFHLHVDPSRAPERLTVIGLPGAVAPLLTDWQSRFGAGIRVIDLIDELAPSTPTDVAAWLRANAGDVTPALCAAAYGVAVDLTPPLIRKRQYGQRLTRLARAACLVSIVAIVAWSGLLWGHAQNARRVMARAQAELAALQSSPVAKDLVAAQGKLAQQRVLLTTVQTRPAWMPWIRSVLATLPEDGRLTNVVVSTDPEEQPGSGTKLSLRLDGSLPSEGPSYALAYRAWVERLEQLAGPGRVRLISEHTIHGPRSNRWAFSVQLEPSIRTVTGGVG